MLVVSRQAYDELVAHAYDGYPEEACGLIAGPPDVGAAVRFYPCGNIAASARVYTIDPKDHLLAERDADDHEWEVIGVVHSHTHSEPYPSPTDVAQAPDPSWHYVIVGLKRDVPEVRSYRIVDGQIAEEAIRIE
ncbi:MAG TPA: M67 family metallopeptidase [Ilumatobacteraceae bacterium]|nr:M67 family metallopeptidase [Ilumatobacteraceae bacterium]